jgi:hypothetical protein
VIVNSEEFQAYNHDLIDHRWVSLAWRRDPQGYIVESLLAEGFAGM